MAIEVALFVSKRLSVIAAAFLCLATMQFVVATQGHAALTEVRVAITR